MDTLKSRERDPEQELLAKEMSGWLEAAVVALPDAFREVFVMRDVEGLSTLETAECLGLNEDTVKTRLHRARRQMRRHLASRIDVAAPAAFQFHARRCDRVVANVLAALGTVQPA
jgi:RNA polymerase sigma-70 factor (ECF subfamily)